MPKKQTHKPKLEAYVHPCPGGDLGACDRKFSNAHAAQIHAHWTHTKASKQRDASPPKNRTSSNSERKGDASNAPAAERPAVPRTEGVQAVPSGESEGGTLEIERVRQDVRPLRQPAQPEPASAPPAPQDDPDRCSICLSVVTKNAPTCPNGHVLEW